MSFLDKQPRRKPSRRHLRVFLNPDGSIWTAYPTGGRGVTRNDENGDPNHWTSNP